MASGWFDRPNWLRRLARIAAVFAVLCLPLAGVTPGIETRADERVVNGNPVPNGAYPFLVFVEHKKFYCTGTLVEADWVMTAAHCATDGRGKALSAGAYRVVVGRTDLRNTNQGERIPVAEVVPHPDWDPRRSDYDVALLRLEREVADATVIALPPAGDGRFERDVQAVTVAGWGLTRQEPKPDTSPRAQEARNQILGETGCRRAWNGITARMICTEQTARSACFGDSGGPLFVRTPGPAADVQVGVTSFGPGTCGSAPVVFARVSNPDIAGFIAATLGPD